MRNLLIRDWGWKLLSLILAAGIWLTVHDIQDPRTTSSSAASSPVIYGKVPVFIVAAAADVHLYHVAPATVSVSVRGSPEAIAVLQANQIRATVDLTDMDSAKDTRRRVDVSVPSGITLVNVDPDHVNVIIPSKP